LRYSKDHKTESRNKILSSALKLFSHKGFDNVSIDEIMVDAGLTRGAFYAHFKTKQVLYSEAILYTFPSEKQKISSTIDRKTYLKKLVSDYLQVDYSNPDVLPCPLAYLVTDVANREPEVRSAYAGSFESLNLKIMHLMSGSDTDINEETILAITSMMIGSVAISRTIPDADKAKLLNACRKVVFRLINAQ